MEKLPKTIIIRITQEQYDYLMSLTRQSGLTLSGLIRNIIQLLMKPKGE